MPPMEINPVPYGSPLVRSKNSSIFVSARSIFLNVWNKFDSIRRNTRCLQPHGSSIVTVFPGNERRSLEHQQTAFESEHYRMEIFTEQDKFVGLLGYWTFDDYIYIEHLAVNPALRSGGYGSRIVSKFLSSTDKTIILEIEQVTDELTARRLHFYERLGFRTNPYDHIQPLYHEDDPTGFHLTILSYPHPITPALYDRFNRQLHSVVLKK